MNTVYGLLFRKKRTAADKKCVCMVEVPILYSRLHDNADADEKLQRY
jgi:hypothetical protein